MMKFERLLEKLTKPEGYPKMPEERRRYMRGYLAGVFAFAWMQDGVYYLGTNGKTLEQFATETDNSLEKEYK